MAKKPPAQFRPITRHHQPTIEKVRSDIKIHCQTEPLIRETLDTIHVTHSEFDNVFSSTIALVDNEKKLLKESQRKQMNALKAIVAAHLSLLLRKARLEDFEQTVRTEKFHQEELAKFREVHPTIISQHYDFTKTLSPDSAIEFLNGLDKGNDLFTKRLTSLLQKHQETVREFIDEYFRIQKKFSEELKQHNIVLSEIELQQLFKQVGGIV